MRRSRSSGRYVASKALLESAKHAFQSPDQPRIIHLAVHPSAWSSAPPSLPTPISPPNPTPLPPDSSFRTSSIFPISQAIDDGLVSQTPHPLTYILNKHQAALSALTQGTLVYPTSSVNLDMLRSMAIRAVEGHGWSWPAILDEKYPPATVGGLRYDSVVIKYVPRIYL